jgi:hypothetical protein
VAGKPLAPGERPGPVEYPGPWLGEIESPHRKEP